MTRIDTALDPAAELKAAVAAPFERAHGMPKSVYTSEAFTQLEVDRLFSREWLCVGRGSSLPKPGDYLATEIAGQPIVVVRGRDGAIRALSNVCRHRMSVLLEGTGNVSAITCPYHAWTYGLDGALRGAPAMGLNEAFDRSGIRLPAIRCEEWQGFVMVNLDPDAAPMAEGLDPLLELIEDYGFGDYVETFSETHRWNTNWKVLAENFMESYHLPVCHMGTIGGHVDLEKMTCPPGHARFNYHWILKNDAFSLTLAHPSNTRLKGDMRRTTWLISIYPSLMITLTPGYFWYLSLHPDGPDHVRILYAGGLAPDFCDGEEAEANFAEFKQVIDRVNAEDKGCTERVYRGLCADRAAPGPLSHLERPNYDFATWIASKM
ncbi:MAG: SRPBCC family protein [Pseudomonadota bacterium]